MSLIKTTTTQILKSPVTHQLLIGTVATAAVSVVSTVILTKIKPILKHASVGPTEAEFIENVIKSGQEAHVDHVHMNLKKRSWMGSGKPENSEGDTENSSAPTFRHNVDSEIDCTIVFAKL